jgi:alanine-glyoxylate transaminase/serine-glyoxylate transaminase/serine-pyruvate transaminase
LQEEGLEKSWARHQRNHQALSAGIEAMGLQFAVKKEDRLPQLNAIIIPNGIDDAVVRTQLLQKYGLEIGAGLGEMAGKLWRVGLMGYGSSLRNVLIFLGALETVLCHLGADIEPGAATKAAQAA